MSSVLAAIVRSPGEVVVRPVPSRTPGPGEVAIEVEGTGVCASNLPLWQGMPWFSYPMPPGQGGHEAWGRVKSVGEGVDAGWIGKRVAALSYRAFAEEDVAHADHIAELPDCLKDQPCPAEALGCAMNIHARADIQRNQLIAIVGIGFLGALLTKTASHAGARVIAISRRTDALQVAETMGAFATIALTDHGRVVEEVKQRTGGAMCDRVIEATGKQGPLDLAGALTRDYARLVIAGYHQDGPRQVDMQLWNYRCLDVINAHERDPAVSMRGIRAALSAIEEGWLDPRPLYTHGFPLTELGAAFDVLDRRPAGFMKAFVETGRSMG